MLMFLSIFVFPLPFCRRSSEAQLTPKNLKDDSVVHFKDRESMVLVLHQFTHKMYVNKQELYLIFYTMYVNKQELYSRARAQEEEIQFLRGQITIACVKVQQFLTCHLSHAFALSLQLVQFWKCKCLRIKWSSLYQELRLLNEKYALERKFADLRMVCPSLDNQYGFFLECSDSFKKKKMKLEDAKV